mmetsp:Transcript_52530/g.170658  ORF Transcript_52530/g.170658 Transcript_52530/m.170658 type:complete len:700 (-) Transcript_52530:73-2172(-)
MHEIARKAPSRSLHARQVGLGLPQRLDLLAAGLRADIEVLDEEVAVALQIGTALGEGLELVQRIAEFGLRRGDALFGLGPLGLEVDDVVVLRLQGRLGCIREQGECFNGIVLGLRRLLLEPLGVRDDVLEQADRAVCVAGALLVLAEAIRGCLLTSGALLVHLHKLHSFLGLGLVPRLDHGQGLLEQGLGGLLVRDGALELGLLLVPVLPGTLELRLQLRDLGLEALDGAGLSRVLHLQGVELGDEALLGVYLFGIPLLVGVQVLDAGVAMHNLFLGLFGELSHHLVDGLLHTREGVEAGRRRQGREPRIRSRELRQHRHRLLARPDPVGGQLNEGGGVEDLAEQILRVVARQDADGLCHGRDLVPAHLLPLPPLLVSHCALRLQLRQEGLVGAKRCLKVLPLLLRLREQAVRASDVLLLLLQRSLAGSDLLFLGDLQLVEGLLVRQFLLLGLREVRLEGSLHLLQDAEDLGGSRLVWCGLAATRTLHKRGQRALLMRRDSSLEKVAVALDVLQRLRHLRDHGGGAHQGGAGVVFGEDDDGRVEGGDGLHHFLLLGDKVRLLLRTQGLRCLQGVDVFFYLLLQARDLRLQRRTLRGQFVDGGAELRQLRLCIRDGLRFRLVVRRAPTRHLFVDFLVGVGLVLEGLLHLLKQLHHPGDRIRRGPTHGVQRPAHAEGGGHGQGPRRRLHCSENWAHRCATE